MPKRIKTKKVKRKKFFFRRRKNFKNNNIRRKVNYPNSTKTQTFGPGNFVVNIEQQFVIDADAAGLYKASVSSYITDSMEFQQYASRFAYYRVSEIGLTIYPSTELKDLETGLGIDWFGTVLDAQGFQTWDAKKLIFNNNVRTKTFFFKLPNTMLEAGNHAGPWNFRNFNSVNIGLPGQVCVNVPGVTRLQGRIIARIQFKVPKPADFGDKKNKNNNNFKRVEGHERLINIPKSKFGPELFQDKGYKKRFKIDQYLEKKEQYRIKNLEEGNFNIIKKPKNVIKNKFKKINNKTEETKDLKLTHENFEIKSEHDSLNSSFVSSYSVVSSKSVSRIDNKDIYKNNILKKIQVRHIDFELWRTEGFKSYLLANSGDGFAIPKNKRDEYKQKILEIVKKNVSKTNLASLHFPEFIKYIEKRLKEVNFRSFDEMCWKMVFKDWDSFLKEEGAFSPELQIWFNYLIEGKDYVRYDPIEEENDEPSNDDEVDFNDDSLYEDEK